MVRHRRHTPARTIRNLDCKLSPLEASLDPVSITSSIATCVAVGRSEPTALTKTDRRADDGAPPRRDKAAALMPRAPHGAAHE